MRHCALPTQQRDVVGFEPRWIESQTYFWACSSGPTLHIAICANCHCLCVDGIYYVKASTVRGKNSPLCAGQSTITLLEWYLETTAGAKA